MIESALTQWGIDSVFTITVDNASANDVGIEYMRKRMKNKSDTVLGGDFLHMRCAAHILNLVVHEGLKDLGDCVTNIRNAVRYVRSSPERMSKFKECIEREKIKCKNMVCLDVPTRWNSTYLMLTTAEKYQRAFDLLGEDEHNHFVVPQPIDWENARAFATFLQTFYEATLKFSGSTHVTSNSYFLQLCIIQNTLNDGCLSEDEVLSSMKALVFWLKKCNGPMWADQIEAKVRDLLNRLIEQYNKFHGRGVGESSNIVEDTRRVDVNPICGDGDKETQYRNMFSQHLVAENDLESIARDVLAIPISTVASESAFSNGGRVLDTFRSSLSPLTVEALICTQDWLKNRPMIYEEVFQDFMESYDEPDGPKNQHSHSMTTDD
ncbi:zinc finger BED domain-containing protein RICESLEEPER 2-like [Alnus glutinosa]|uniref:zinc finger BED domain-containing protein RICESLEEPER 2-like n=1 Tax=Alnus glutinosa TaxID=3517 RepID=UPI002D76D1D4|nr:zinc finger BED domain-containing protein RICESLEEPER 2-like [Alnus glutinosa]